MPLEILNRRAALAVALTAVSTAAGMAIGSADASPRGSAPPDTTEVPQSTGPPTPTPIDPGDVTISVERECTPTANVLTIAITSENDIRGVVINHWVSSTSTTTNIGAIAAGTPTTIDVEGSPNLDGSADVIVTMVSGADELTVTRTGAFGACNRVTGVARCADGELEVVATVESDGGVSSGSVTLRRDEGGMFVPIATAPITGPIAPGGSVTVIIPADGGEGTGFAIELDGATDLAHRFEAPACEPTTSSPPSTSEPGSAPTTTVASPASGEGVGSGGGALPATR